MVVRYTWRTTFLLNMEDEFSYNPSDYVTGYQDSTDVKGLSQSGNTEKELASSLQKGLFDYALKDKWFNEHESFQAQLNQLVDSGVNPNVAVAMLSGNNISGSGSPSAGSGASDDYSQRFDAILGAAASVNDSVKADMDRELNRRAIDADASAKVSTANLQNAQAESIKIDNLTKLPLNNELLLGQSLQNRNTAAQYDVIKETFDLTHEQWRSAKIYADNLPAMTAKEIDRLSAETADYWQKIAASKTEQENIAQQTENLKTQQENIAQQTENLKTQQEKTAQEIENLKTEQQNTSQQTENLKTENSLNEQLKGYQDLIGHPLSASEKDVIVGYIRKGDYSGLVNMLEASYAIKLSESNAEAIGGDFFNPASESGLEARKRFRERLRKKAIIFGLRLLK